MRRSLSVLAGLALAGSTLAAVAPASAAPKPYDPNVTRIANPANVCKSIPGSVAHASGMLGVDIDTSSFDFSDCARMLAKGDAFVEPAEEFGSPYVQCDLLLTFGVTYPYTFHNDPDPANFEDAVLPDLTAKNRKQCGSALYAFHSIFTYVGPYLPPEPPEEG